MKSKPIVLTTFFVLSVWTYFFTFTGNAISEEEAVKIYHFRAKVDMLAISRNLQVEEEKPGGLVIEKLKIQMIQRWL
ncbi:MAG: hypothetical protein FJ241_11940 [Nitrospira sp.]|nr:hypothetical protein [Nitrospira sp.]